MKNIHILGRSYCGSTIVGNQIAKDFGLDFVGELHRIRRWNLNDYSGPKPRCKTCGINCKIWTEKNLRYYAKRTEFSSLNSVLKSSGFVDSSKITSWFNSLEKQYILNAHYIHVTKHPLRHIASFFDHQSKIKAPVPLNDQSLSYVNKFIKKLELSENNIVQFSKKFLVPINKLKYEDVINQNENYYNFFKKNGYTINPFNNKKYHPLGGNFGAHLFIKIKDNTDTTTHFKILEKKILNNNMSLISKDFYTSDDIKLDDKYSQILTPSLISEIKLLQQYRQLLETYDYQDLN